VFDLWWHTYRRQVEHRNDSETDGLVWGFGVALMERAILDAACRQQGCSFFEALKSDLFQIRPEQVYPQLAGWDVGQSLPEIPLRRVQVRHTVGLADALRSSDVPADERREDGFPESLEEDLRRYGLRHFKIKLGGERQADLQRLLKIAGVLEEGTVELPRITLDGNEQVQDLDGLHDLLTELQGIPEARLLSEGLLYIEQPLPRARSLDSGFAAGLARLSEVAPVILDESDSSTGVFPQALEFGYRGISVKNCKGVLKALLHRGLCEQAEVPAFQSAEDLTNLPLLALQQDLTTVATLGLEHVERNGHHYFAGLQHLPEEEVAAALEQHGDLYGDGPGGPQLRIEAGRLQIGSLQCPGYGHALPIRVDRRTPAPAGSLKRA
jgi:hypothetical protein